VNSTLALNALLIQLSAPSIYHSNSRESPPRIPLALLNLTAIWRQSPGMWLSLRSNAKAYFFS